MKLKKIISWVLLGLLVGIQFVPTKPNRNEVVPKSDFMLVNEVPNNIKSVLQESCYDCHSNNTRYPWYNHIQPIAWLLENHISEGKSELNFNEWGNYSWRKKRSKLNSIKDQIRDDEMPLWSYTLMHKEAVLSESEKTTVIYYMQNLQDNLNENN